MAFHSHGDRQFEARRIFTDRKEPVALFEQAFAEGQERDNHRVICWHGVGGQGKSSLHDEIRRRIAGNPDVALAGLDFDRPSHRRLEDAMLKLRGDLAGRGLNFPTFDLAFARLFALERPGENIRQVHPQLYRRGESQIVDDMLDWSEAGVDVAVEGISLAVPGLNLLYKYGARLTGRLGDWWSSQAVKGKLAGLDQLSNSEIAEHLPQYLGFDVWRARGEIGCPRIVITIDTHEKLGRGELRGDAWLQTLVRETPGALILIFGRDSLRWAELDERWEDVLDQHLLGALSDEDADTFLAQVPVPDADVRARIVGSAEGLPHYLDLAVSLYEDIRNAGETPRPEDFGTTPAQVRERFLDHLPPDERRELFLAAYPESLSERLFLDLADAFLGGAGNVNWARLGRRSFMTEGSDGRLVMHTLMREALQDQEQAERTELFARVHAWLFDHYSTRARVPDAMSVTPEAEQAFLAAYGHAALLSREKLLGWIYELHSPFLDALRWHTLERIYSSAIKRFPETSHNRTWLLHDLARVSSEMGSHAEAAALYEEALEFRKAMQGETHPYYAGTLNELARSQEATGRHAKAAALYEQAVGILQAARSAIRTDYLVPLQNLAGVRHTMGCYAEAEALYEQTLNARAEFGETHSVAYATNLHELARLRQRAGRHTEAEALYRQAVEIYETELGQAHPYAILAHASIAGCLASLSRIDAARGMFEGALARAEVLTADAALWTGRVRLKWAHGLLGAGLREEASAEARAARELLIQVLGLEAEQVQEAAMLIEDSGARG